MRGADHGSIARARKRSKRASGVLAGPSLGVECALHVARERRNVFQHGGRSTPVGVSVGCQGSHVASPKSEAQTRLAGAAVIE